MRALLAFGLAALVAAPAAARPAQTFAPPGARLALELPHGWHTTRPDHGWRFEAIGPGYSGWVFLSVVRATVTNRSFQRSFVAFERSATKRLGPHVIFRSRRTTIGSEPAVEIYAAARATNTELVYGFQHAGLEYILAYATTTSRFAEVRPSFAASAGSVRFLD